MRYLKALLCLFLLSFSLAGQAQELHVASDTIRILKTVKFRDSSILQEKKILRYGLKDKNGNWVIKAEYQAIYQYPHCFVLHKNSLLKPEAKNSYIFTDLNGKTKAEYNFFMQYHKNFVVYRGGRRAEKYRHWQGGKRGLLDAYGNELQAPVYDHIMEHKNGAFLTVKGGRPDKYSEYWIGGKFGLIDSKGQVICPNEYDYISGAAPHEQNINNPPYSLIAVNKGGTWVNTVQGWVVTGGKWGLLNREYKTIAAPKYAWYSQVGNFIKVNVGGHEKLNEPHKQVERNFSPKTIVDGGLWGYIDTLGNELVPIKYTWISSYRIYTNPSGRRFGTKVFVASKEPLKKPAYNSQRISNLPHDVHFGLVSLNGKELTEFRYTELDPSYPYRGKVRAAIGGTLKAPFWDLQDASWGFLDSSGREITQFNYAALYCGNRNEYIIYDKKDSSGRVLKGFMNQDLEIITPPEYTDLYFATSSKALYVVCNKDKKWALLNNHAEPLTDSRYKSIRQLDSIYFIVEASGCNIVRRDGKEMFEEWTDPSTCFNAEGYLLKQRGSKWGAINHLGDTVMPFQFDECKWIPHRNKLALVKSNGKWGVYDLSSRSLVLAAEYDELSPELVKDKTMPYPYIVIRSVKDGRRGKLKEELGGGGGASSYFRHF